MDLELTDDQELFRETTAKFFERTCPISTVREWAEKEPAGYPERLVAAGRRARMDVVAGVRGGRRGQCVGSWPAGPDPGGRGDGSAGVPGAALARRTWWPPRSPSTDTGAQRRRYLPGILSGEAIATWCLGDRRSVLRSAACAAARRRPRGEGSSSPGRKARRRRRPRPSSWSSPRWSTATPPSSSSTPTRPASRSVAAEASISTHRFGFGRVRPGRADARAVLGEVGGAAGPDRAAVRVA